MRAALAAPDRRFGGHALDLDGTVYLRDRPRSVADDLTQLPPGPLQLAHQG